MKLGNKANLFVFLTRDLVTLTNNELAKWLQPWARRELIVYCCLANKATVSLAINVSRDLRRINQNSSLLRQLS